MGVFVWILILLGVAFVTMLGSLLDLSEFMNKHQSIDSYETLGEFKKMVRRQMYLSVVQLVVFWGVALCTLYAGLVGELGLQRFVLVAIVVAVLYGVSRGVDKTREAARNLLTADKGLEGLYSAVTQMWSEKTLPDF